MSNNPRIHARFVLLHHDWPESHWDFLVDLDGNSERVPTWSLDAPLLDQPSHGKAQKLSDHRRIYLDYQGPVSGDRGTVRQVMTGTIEVVRQNQDDLEFILIESAVLKGTLAIKRLSDKTNDIHKTHRYGAELDWEYHWSPMV